MWRADENCDVFKIFIFMTYCKEVQLYNVWQGFVGIKFTRILKNILIQQVTKRKVQSVLNTRNRRCGWNTWIIFGAKPRISNTEFVYWIVKIDLLQQYFLPHHNHIENGIVLNYVQYKLQIKGLQSCCKVYERTLFAFDSLLRSISIW
jgi:hypothetical protein